MDMLYPKNTVITLWGWSLSHPNCANCSHVHIARLLLLRRVLNSGLSEEGLHRVILVGEAPNGKILRLVVRDAKVPFRTEERRLCLLKRRDLIVDLLYGVLELLACEAIVVAEALLELEKLLLEVGDID